MRALISAKPWTRCWDAPALVTVDRLRQRHSRLAPSRWFERSLLVAIFVWGFFAFYKDQVTAVFGAAVILARLRLLAS